MFSISKNNGPKPSAMKLVAGVLLGATIFYVPLVTAAPIYKVVDEQTGQVTFTDNPQSYEQQSGTAISQTGITTGNSTSQNTNNRENEVSSSNSQSSQLLSTRESAPPTMTDNASSQQAAAVNYQLAITDPKEERAYQRPGQIISVNLQMSPALQSGDSVSIYLDDNLISQGVVASIATINVDPGQHTIRAVIQNSSGQIINQVTRTVYVIQNTSILQNKRRIAQQLAAYQKLPLHQKMLLKMRRDKTVKP